MIHTKVAVPELAIMSSSLSSWRLCGPGCGPVVVMEDRHFRHSATTSLDRHNAATSLDRHFRHSAATSLDRHNAATTELRQINSGQTLLTGHCEQMSFVSPSLTAAPSAC